MKKDAKKNLLAHSEAKVRLLGEYLNKYLNIISNDGFTNSVNIYDLFCGEGIYENGGEGSPLVIMSAIKNVHYQNVGKIKLSTKLNCFFNDVDQAKINKTQNAIANNKLYYPNFGTLEFTSYDYENYIEELIAKLGELKNEKAFVFIDPYGYRGIKMSHIKGLMANKKTEVLLWLPTQFMYRFEKNGTPTALKDFIEEVVPYKDWQQSTSVWIFINELKQAFQNSMGSDFFVDNFTIKKDRNTVFCLFFFTSHIKGFEKMLESKWKIDQEQGRGWNFQENQLSLFQQQKTFPLEDALGYFLRENSRTNGEVYEFTLRQGFLPRHTNDIFRNWQKIGKLSVWLADGIAARKNSFYISYPYYKIKTEEGFSKVTFKIK